MGHLTEQTGRVIQDSAELVVELARISCISHMNLIVIDVVKCNVDKTVRVTLVHMQIRLWSVAIR